MTLDHVQHCLINLELLMIFNGFLESPLNISELEKIINSFISLILKMRSLSVCVNVFLPFLS